MKKNLHFFSQYVLVTRVNQKNKLKSKSDFTIGP
jgi:hypothetical protein